MDLRSPWLFSALVHGAILGIGALTLIDFKRQPKVAEFVVIENPKPAPAAPIRPKAPPPKPATQPRAVFGVSRKAITTDSESAVEAKAGNTLAKAPDQARLRPEDADSLPVPTEEYLVTAMPELMAEVRVPYPAEAKERRIDGAVVMDLLIDAEGKVREVRLVSGPGAGLNEAAVNAARGFRFKPAKVNDGAVAVRIRYAYRFVLEN